MGHGHKVSCVLCQRSDETKITGALSTKDQVTAHQNCLLFSSGIFCRSSPQFDDLFGFSVEDVMHEVKRGSKLMCNKCKKKGATAGCEVKRCKKSYHYPCAVLDGAETVEDGDKGKYGLYCLPHYQKTEENSSSVNGHASSFTKSKPSKDLSEAGPSKVYCLACEKTEGSISLESLSNRVILLYCDKHAPASHKRNTSGDSTAARLSAYSSDSSRGNMKHSSFKKRLIFNDKQQEPPAKRKPEQWKKIITDDSSDSDENQPDTDMAIFAPLESDLDGDSQVSRKNTESPTGSTSGNQLKNESEVGFPDEDESDTESDSLLPPVRRSMETQTLSTTNAALAQTVSPAQSVEVVKIDDDSGSSPEQSPVHSPDQHSAGPPHSPDRSKPCSLISSPPCTSSAISPAPPATTSSPAALPSDPEPSIDSTSFWKSCNGAGCTRAIFTDFINEMNDISSRIQSDQASQEDYDLALTVMEASGKLAELVTKQQKELQRKQVELHKAASSMKKVVSALRR